MNHKFCSIVILSLWGVCTIFASTPTDKKQEPKLKFWHNEPRELRYTPDGDDFVGINGKKRFTRAIYGTNSGFRFETSDYPEFGLYMPNLGGSVYMAIQTPDKLIWIKDLENIESRFSSGIRSYTLTDKKILGNGSLKITAVALSDADGFVVKTEPENIPAGVKILWIYGGANNVRFSREGDLGADPIDCFYIKPERCDGNIFEIKDNNFTVYYGKGTKVLSQDQAYENPSALRNIKIDAQVMLNANKISGVFPTGTTLRVADANLVNTLDKLVKSESSSRPILIAEYSISDKPFYMGMHNPKTLKNTTYAELENAYNKGDKFRTDIAGKIKLNTPDPFFNTLGGVFSGAEDAVWENPGYLHGAIGWRVPLTGWRAAYLGDLKGMHDRARTHFNGYANSQVKNVPVTKPHTQDVGMNMARSAKIWGTPMYSNGYITRQPNKTTAMHHYDMNIVFIDELLWHLNWTGDKDYARQIFPIIKSHLAWEKQVYDPDNDFLYDAYCCIWASDALQYNGGVATHATAYNYRSNKIAAELAVMLGEDPTPYQKEADGILKAINNTLWIKDKGWWAEFKDNMGHKMLHESAAAWTIYHSIDSEVHDPFKAYEATRYIDTELPHIPVLANGLNDTTNYVIGTTTWQPYIWSINNVAFGEITHSALAYWQSGRYEEAYKIFKGTVLDAMYLGSGPGNITQISFYDAARRETYRDFADPAATGLRAIVHGMYGIIPDLLNEKLTIRPGFPAAWNFASIETMNMKYDFKRSGAKDTYTFEPMLRVKPILTLELNARKDRIKSVSVNGKKINYSVVADAINMPKIVIEAGKADKYKIVVEWAGKDIKGDMVSIAVAEGDAVAVALNGKLNKIYDPQGALSNGAIANGRLTGNATGKNGNRTVYVNITNGDMTWWMPIDIKIQKQVELINYSESKELSFSIVNNMGKALKGELFVNNTKTGNTIDLTPNAKAEFSIAAPVAVFGTNNVVIKTADKSYNFHAVNWIVAPPKNANYEKVDISNVMNDKVRDIFAYGKYLAPRWEFTTLQVPTQGMGQWCHPTDLSKIDDSGIRAKAGKKNTFVTPQGVPFATPSDNDAKNIAFTTLWNNYPNSISTPLNGKASRVYLLIAASTYHMQANILNGEIKVKYTDGTQEVLPLILPETLLPLDQDIFVDNVAFLCKETRPYRISLKSGEMFRDLTRKNASNGPIYINGGLATIIDMPLDSNKELASLSVETIANEVIIGLMSATLVR